MKYIRKVSNIESLSNDYNMPGIVLISYKDSTGKSVVKCSASDNDKHASDGHGYIYTYNAEKGEYEIGALTNVKKHLKDDLHYDEDTAIDACKWVGTINKKLTLDEFTIGKNIYDNWDPATTSINSKWRNGAEPTSMFFPNIDLTNVTDAYKAWHGCTNVFFAPMNLPNATSLDGLFWYHDSAHLPKVINIDKPLVTGNVPLELGTLKNDVTINYSQDAPNFIAINEYLASGTLTINMPNVTTLNRASGLMRGISIYKDATIILNFGKSINVDHYFLSLFGSNGTECPIDGQIIINGKDFIGTEILAFILYGNNVKKLPVFNITGRLNAEELLALIPSIDTTDDLNLLSAYNANYLFYGSRLYNIGNIHIENALETEGLFSNWFSDPHYIGKVGKVYVDSTNDIEDMFTIADGAASDFSHFTDFGGFINLGKGFIDSTTSRHTLDLTNCYALSHNSLMNIINGLYKDTPTTANATLKLGEANYSKLSENEISIAISKHWTVII